MSVHEEPAGDSTRRGSRTKPSRGNPSRKRLEEEEEGDAPRCSRTHPALLPVLDHDDAAGEVEKRQLVSVVCESAQPVLEAA